MTQLQLNYKDGSQESYVIKANFNTIDQDIETTVFSNPKYLSFYDYTNGEKKYIMIIETLIKNLIFTDTNG